ncbi:hypothetical protein ACJIZ3_023560 [Penstemon smallii]|uniref:F-box domain-containing protein n=1 Tax=Penstemon smallii TaxID=265156 RepID=A0ABD3TPF0_9LAMI
MEVKNLDLNSTWEISEKYVIIQRRLIVNLFSSRISSMYLSTKKLSVAAEKVEANHDLLMSILVRLPPKSVFRFRCVSNRWNNIIVDPYFLRSYSAITRKHGSLRGEHMLAIVHLTSLNVSRISDWGCKRNNNMVPRKLGDFITCSNGLVLCRDRFSYNTYHVWNPLTKKSVSLPPLVLAPYKKIISVAFVCEENTNELIPNYMVIRAGVTRFEEWVIETYSSRTGKWAAKSKLNTSPEFHLCAQPTPLVCNGVVHWSGMGSIALYDLNGGKNANHLMQLIRLPILELEYWSLTRSEHDDVLWLGYTDRIHKNMRTWMLPKKINDGRSYRRSTTIPANEWILMHTITMTSLLKEPALKLLENNNKRNDPRSEWIWLEGFIIPSNPTVVVIRREKRVFIYNLETKLMDSIQYDDGGRGPCTIWWDPYMESHYLSSYAL